MDLRETSTQARCIFGQMSWYFERKFDVVRGLCVPAMATTRSSVTRCFTQHEAVKSTHIHFDKAIDLFGSWCDHCRAGSHVPQP